MTGLNTFYILFDSCVLITVRGLVIYDGTDYHGFQYQPNVPTIQNTLEIGIEAFAERQSRVIGSGRTDTGVHAKGQVVSVKVLWPHTVNALQKAWNAHLPNSVRIEKVQLAPTEFHPRFSAVNRTYRYYVYQRAIRNGQFDSRYSPLTDRFALYEPQLLDIHQMNEACQVLLGWHDFATFGQPPQGENTIRQVVQAVWQTVDTNLASLQTDLSQYFVFTVQANAFLRQMVRNFVGTLLKVGRGEWSPNDVQCALEAKNRGRSAPPASPRGLVLEKVNYPIDLRLE